MKIYDFEGKKNISGDHIRQARMTMRLSQADLAARMQVNGVSIEREAISKIETGDRFVTDYELFIFAKVLGVSMERLTARPHKKKQNTCSDKRLHAQSKQR